MRPRTNGATVISRHSRSRPIDVEVGVLIPIGCLVPLLALAAVGRLLLRHR